MKIMTIVVRDFKGNCLDQFLLTNEKMFDIMLKNVRKCYGDDIMVESCRPKNIARK